MKRSIIWIKVSSISMIILGLIHLIATVAVVPMFKGMGQESLQVFIFMYISAGLLTVLLGLLPRLMLKNLKNKDVNAHFVILICSVFSSILGLGAVAAMPDNLFAYLMLIIAGALLIPTLLIKKHLNKDY